MIDRGTRRRPANRPQHDSIIRGGASSKGRRGNKVAARFFAYFIIFLAVAALVAASIFVYAQVRFNANEQIIKGLASKTPSQPMNVLLLGSDDRRGLSKEQQKRFGNLPGKRADTIILLHLDEKFQKAVLVQFPRELRVTKPDGTATKINGIYEKGPDPMVAQVKKLTGLPVHHYVEVDFNGFNNIVDTLGGVNVYFERPVRDSESGLDVPKGCVKIEGDQALAFVRVRKIDDDFGRIARQQLFVKLMLDKIMTPQTFLNPPKVVRLVNTFTRNVTHDADLSVSDLQKIAFRLKGFDSGKVDMRVIPSSGARIGRVSYVVANRTQSDALFSAIRSRKPLPDYGRTGVSSVDPSDVKVAVLNGTKVDKLAQNQAAALSGKGYRVTGTGGADPHSQTTVYFAPGNEERAKLVAAEPAYGSPPVKPLPGSLPGAGDVTLVLGQDFASGRATPAPRATEAAPSAAKPLVHPCDG